MRERERVCVCVGGGGGGGEIIVSVQLALSDAATHISKRMRIKLHPKWAPYA